MRSRIQGFSQKDQIISKYKMAIGTYSGYWSDQGSFYWTSATKNFSIAKFDT